MFLSFEKWHGCLNDFVVIWISDIDGDVVLDSLKRQAQRLCDRRAGIGADGLLILRTKTRESPLPDRLVIINSDGSIAKNCGNGLRCAALSILKNYATRGPAGADPLEVLELKVEGTTYTCRFMPSRSGPYPLVAIEMGMPTLNDDVTWYGAAKTALRKVAGEFKIPTLDWDIGVAEIGNPHIVITTDHAARDLALKLGPALQSEPLSGGVNLHIVRSEEVSDKDRQRAGTELGQAISEVYKAYVWERGAGETMACGSGACAIGAIALQTGLAERDAWVAVDMPGGRLYVKWEDENEALTLAGPGSFVFAGTVEI